jgi:hypothetical protein
LLNQQEIDLKQCVKDRLAQLFREEEIRWFQRAKTLELLEGDSNTKYFQARANGKGRKTRIFRLEQDHGVVEGEEALNQFITDFYKKLFSSAAWGELSLDESRREDIPQVSTEENDMLTAKKEIREAIFQMKHNKPSGPDGFPAEFYQVFWSVIKDDLLAMFEELHEEKLPLFSLNFGIITLVPKLEEVTRIEQYRPICMLNVSFKVFTKCWLTDCHWWPQKLLDHLKLLL